MRNSLIFVLLGAVVLVVFATCKKKVTQKKLNDSYISGNATFVADESFAPILDQELYIFKNQYPDAKPVMIYKSENEAVKLLLEDSIRLAFLSRDLTPDETKIMNSHTLPVRVDKFAIDAVTLIVNEASADTTISVGEIKKMLNGEIKTDKSIVFDNPNSSLVRYLKEFTGNKEFKQKNIYALKSNKDVIDYVSKHPDAIGITGFNWLNDPDSDYAEALKKVKIVGVRDENSKNLSDQYFKPSQSSLALKQYPLIRNLYIVNCTGRKGLGAGFQLFIESENGQRIILTSGLLPVLIPHREIIIHDKF